MKTFLTGLAFVVLCVIFAGIFTAFTMSLAGCADARAALTAYHIENMLTIHELKQLKGIIQ